jgi:hypothetical protein
MSQPPTDPNTSIARTFQNLNTVDNQTLVRLSQLTLAEIEELKQVVKHRPCLATSGGV